MRLFLFAFALLLYGCAQEPSAMREVFLIPANHKGCISVVFDVKNAKDSVINLPSLDEGVMTATFIYLLGKDASCFKVKDNYFNLYADGERRRYFYYYNADSIWKARYFMEAGDNKSAAVPNTNWFSFCPDSSAKRMYFPYEDMQPPHEKSNQVFLPTCLPLEPSDAAIKGR